LNGLKILVLYDNVSAQKMIKPAWGFSALVEFGGKKLLFDTGGRADVLLANMKALRVVPGAVDVVFLSHSHWDHAGGLFGFLGKNHRVKVYVPASFSQIYRNEIGTTGAKCVGVAGFTRLAEGIYSTGGLGTAIVEQALVLDTPRGLVVITGCAHPGILKIVEQAKRSLGKPVYAVLGGFHLASQSVAEVKKIIAEFKRLGVAYVGPCHCTGEKAIKQFKAEYKDGFLRVGAGLKINV
jgi:7,8-dihydropterin-6-yl-methyl-4-(beta-D-ribofuranosyl)aminobenzene 5'-phosphate synthase